jgi:hypothetical protein
MDICARRCIMTLLPRMTRSIRQVSAFNTTKCRRFRCIKRSHRCLQMLVSTSQKSNHMGIPYVMVFQLFLSKKLSVRRRTHLKCLQPTTTPCTFPAAQWLAAPDTHLRSPQSSTIPLRAFGRRALARYTNHFRSPRSRRRSKP